MVYYFNYIIYIIYSFLFLFCSYICLLIYKKYSFTIFNLSNDEILTNEKYSEKVNKKKNYNKYHTSLVSNTSKKIKNIKSQYKIKSTEKTYEEIKFISQKPNYINLSNINMHKFNFKNIIGIHKIKNYNDDILIQKITEVYLKTKQEFISQFVCSETNKYFINNINEFSSFHKNNLPNCSNTNILIKFYNGNNLPEHKYIFVNQYKMIKIINNEEYDNICNMIEKNNGTFMLEDTNNNIIGYGSYLQSEITSSDIKKIFFSNSPNCEINKNYKLLCEYTNIKIYFYVCNLI